MGKSLGKLKIIVILGIIVVMGLALWAFFLRIDSPAFLGLIEAAKGRLLSKPNSPLSNSEVNAIAHLISIGAVLPAEVVLSSIVDFYETIINVLLALMTAIGIVAFMFVKSNSTEAATAHAQSAVSTYFESQKFAEMTAAQIANDVSEQVSDEIALQITDFDDIREGMAEFSSFKEDQENIIKALQCEVEELKNELIALSAAIASNDNEEETGQAGDIDGPIV